MNTIYLITAVALVSSLLMTPVVRRIALRLNIVDHPDSHRKLHKEPIPLGGGWAVVFGMAVAALVLVLSNNPWQESLHERRFFLLCFAASIVGIAILGTIDDRFGLRGRQKGLGQLLIAGSLIAAGVMIQKIHFFGWRIDLGMMAIPFTLFWLLGAMNAFNLIDGIDGLASSVGAVIGLAIAVMAFLSGHPVDGIIALALVGSLVGFLFHNYPPASIFLGDAGSMLIGLVIGVLGIQSSLKGPATIALVAPTAILAIPAFDVGMAILRRKLTGRSIYVTDRGHLHHCLQRRGYSGKKTVFVIGIFCLLTATAAVVSVYLKNEFLALGGVLAVIGTMTITKMFGHSECVLLLQRIKKTLLSFVSSRKPASKSAATTPLVSRFGGSHEWEELWETLTHFADRFDLTTINLNVSLPAIHEEYHASWSRKKPGKSDEIWETQLPLIVHGQPVGRLQIHGEVPTEATCMWVGEVIDGLKPFEMQINEIVADLLPSPESSTQVAPASAQPELLSTPVSATGP